MALGDGFFIPSVGDLTFSPDKTDFLLRLPAGVELAPDAKFRLFSTEGPAFDKTLTGADDLSPGPEFAELLFTDVPVKSKFSLEAAPGGGKPVNLIFQERTLEQLSGSQPLGAASPTGFTPSESSKQDLKKKEAYE